MPSLPLFAQQTLNLSNSTHSAQLDSELAKTIVSACKNITSQINYGQLASDCCTGRPVASFFQVAVMATNMPSPSPKITDGMRVLQPRQRLEILPKRKHGSEAKEYTMVEVKDMLRGRVCASWSYILSSPASQRKAPKLSQSLWWHHILIEPYVLHYERHGHQG